MGEVDEALARVAAGQPDGALQSLSAVPSGADDYAASSARRIALELGERLGE